MTTPTFALLLVIYFALVAVFFVVRTTFVLLLVDYLAQFIQGFLDQPLMVSANSALTFVVVALSGHAGLPAPFQVSCE